MKKITLFIAFVFTVSVANAWMKNCEEGIVIMATQHLNPATKVAVEKYLGTSYADDVYYLVNLEKKKQAKHTKEIHYVHVGNDMNPASADTNDALVALESALEVVRNHNTRPLAEVRSALRTVINLMNDIHHLSNYRFEGIPYSQKVHKFSRVVYDYGKTKGETTTVNWSRLWAGYSGRYTGYSGQYWAYEMNLCKGNKFEEYSAGTLRDWVAENSAKAAGYLERYTPDYVMSPTEFNQLEDVNYDMMVRASFRLAAILNSCLK